MISVDKLTIRFGSVTLFNDISYVVNPKDKIALVGKNGAGKSTMLKVFAGIQPATSGSVSVPKDVTIGYLPQHMIHNDGVTVMEEAEKAFSDIFELQKEIERMTVELSERTDYESASYQQLIERLTHANERLDMMGVNNFKGEVEKTLLGLGFVRSDFTRQTSEFSGGWRMRIELAKILLKRPDVLLLDEPTNHLDIESIQWLEEFLKSSGSAVILVSHDRAFIDAVTNRTIEISLGKIYDYKVSYSKYVELRKERREQQLRAYENQQKQIQDTEDFIERFRYKATKSNQVQSRIKQLEKLDIIEVDEEDNSALHLKFPPAPHSGTITVEAQHLTKRYGDNVVLEDIDLTIKRGEKVAFVGKNGEGKSTLVKCIMEQIPYDGTLKLGHLVKIGYFAQNQASLLDENLTVFDTIDRVAVGDVRTKIRDILGAFMFGGEASDKKVKVLSGGERTRLAMIRLLLEPVNFLVLDEPTNHLDMRSKDVLKDAIKAFNGTVVVVSHDREFLDGLVDKVYEFGNHKIKEHLGGIYDFLQSKKMASLQELERKAQPQVTEAKEVKPSDNKLSYEAKKELTKKIRKAEKAVADSEAEINAIEQRIAEIETELQNPENATNTALFDEYKKKKHELEQKMYEWELLSEELETVKAQA
ncbi:MAG: ABC-F family ATP-binding cassette domain-containing protein [Paludibacteraceae bacterium]|nr:ABC-F family ATP-binding cassette domain-containing protein [Paludibacteraceae bacterium]MBR5374902.1 ABC-F family ATP-binding cassette domain-containing protein [Paludibacteraceae bacterium]MCR5498168.1 ABC-F family ATP-binding cassette domain-containing protein [Paludibacteraceae bacterium]